MIDLALLEKKLRTRRAELTRDLVTIETALDEAPPKDWEDRAAERQGDEMLEALGAHDLAELRRIDAALDRIAEGTYGQCAICGDEISWRRLDAVPETPHCAVCAGAR